MDRAYTPAPLLGSGGLLRGATILPVLWSGLSAALLLPMRSVLRTMRQPVRATCCLEFVRLPGFRIQLAVRISPHRHALRQPVLRHRLSRMFRRANNSPRRPKFHWASKARTQTPAVR
jgi:hypothetical protein